MHIKALCDEEFTAAQVMNATDYYPFGMPMPNHMFVGSNGAYRFAFQGQEHDNEPGTEHDFFKLRTWDGRLGRWTSTDPYGQYHSAYLGMGNNPVSMMDPDGGWAGGGWLYKTAQEIGCAFGSVDWAGVVSDIGTSLASDTANIVVGIFFKLLL